MKRSRKTNRVSWAPAPKLCQVKLFFSEDYPSKVGQKYQNHHLKAKNSSMLHPSSDECDDIPPGFEGGNRFLNQPKAKVTHVSCGKWKCPPRFAINANWCVAAGEASVEKEGQKQRELRVLEAVYPRLSAIPPSPSVYFNVEKEDYDDSLTPILPTEEVLDDSMDTMNNPEVAAVTKLSDTPTTTHLQSQNLPQPHLSATSLTSSQCITTSSACGKHAPGNGISPPGLEADLGAASAVVAAIMKSNEQGSLIDMDLLVKIFNDPIMIEKLIKQYTMAATPGLKPSIPSSKPTPDMAAKQSAPSVPVWSSSTLEKPPTPSIPLGGRPVVSGNSSTTSVTLPKPTPPPPISTPHMHMPINKNIQHKPPTQQDINVVSSGVKRAAPFAPVSSSCELNTVPLPSTTVPYQQPASSTGSGSAFAMKDADYYKNLIRQHGSDRQQDAPQVGIPHNNYFQNSKPLVHNIKPGEGIFRFQKPCLYFKSSKGCRNGFSCPYQHDDMSVQWGASNILMAQNAKRMKLAPEIKGRT